MNDETKIDDGGAAFPSQYHEHHDPTHYHGMSLRQWYAGMALQGILANSVMVDLLDDEGIDWVVEKATILADAMIALGKAKP